MAELLGLNGSGGKGSWVHRERPQPGSGVWALIPALPLVQHFIRASALQLPGLSFPSTGKWECYIYPSQDSWEDRSRTGSVCAWSIVDAQ